MTQPTQPKKIMILGGGFAGVYTALRLQQNWKDDPSVRITLVSRTNYFLMTPLLFEAGSGILEPRHVVNPIRRLFTKANFVQAEIESIDLAAKNVTARLAHEQTDTLPFDHLVLALGGVTNTKILPGAENALTFKSLADAIFLRNHTIQRFERADVEHDRAAQTPLLTFVIIGAGLVGVELMGELSDFIQHVAPTYRSVDPKSIRYFLIEAGPRIAPEFDEDLADHAADVLRRRGVDIRTAEKVKRIEHGRVQLDDGTIIDAGTIVVATGVVPNPLLQNVDLIKNKRGNIEVEATMRAKGRNDVWAIGDCASIPDPQGKPYPPLAQHALREGRVLADNITAAIRGQPLNPFIYQTKGTLAALGRYDGIGRIGKIRIRGILAWFVWRSYYLWQMPRWERRLRIVLDWTIALFFRNDVVQIDLDRVAVERNTPANDPKEITASNA